MSSTFSLEVLRPTERVYEGKVVSFTASALDGELGVLAGHAPLLTVLGEGKMNILPEEGSQFAIEISSGLLKVENNVAQVFLPR